TGATNESSRSAERSGATTCAEANVCAAGTGICWPACEGTHTAASASPGPIAIAQSIANAVRRPLRLNVRIFGFMIIASCAVPRPTARRREVGTGGRTGGAPSGIPAQSHAGLTTWATRHPDSVVRLDFFRFSISVLDEEPY